MKDRTLSSTKGKIRAAKMERIIARLNVGNSLHSLWRELLFWLVVTVMFYTIYYFTRVHPM